MNILILSTHLKTGGITSYIITLAKGLQQKGHNVTVATSGGDMIGELVVSGAGHVEFNIRTKSELSPKIYFSLAPLCRLMRDNKIDIIHAQTRITQVMASFLSRMTVKPYVTTCHGFFKKRLSRRVFPCWGQGVIAISRPVRDHLINDFNLPKTQVELIYNGIDLSQFAPASAEQKARLRRRFNLGDEPVVGIVARLSQVKGHEYLIDAMKKVLVSVPRAILLIAGEGNLEGALRRKVEDLGIGPSVRFYPVSSRPEDVLSLLDVFVMPSLQEGLGLSVMEAQAMGLAVVASRVGGLPDLIEGGKTGLLVSPGDSGLLAQAIVEVLLGREKASEMGARARAFIEREFSCEKMTAETLKFYEKSVHVYEKNPGR